MTQTPVAHEATAPTAGRRSERAHQALWPIATVLVLALLWQGAVAVGIINALLMPPPTEIFAALGMLLTQSYFWVAFGWTMLEVVLGFLLGTTLGFGAGLAVGTMTFARRTLYPLAVALQSTPQVAIAPLFLIWFGFGIEPRVFFAALSCFFPILVAVVVGLKSADADSRTLLRSMGASRWTSYRRLLFPASLPTLFAGLRLAVPAAFVGAIVGEFVGGNEGLGVLVTTFNSQLQIAETFAVVLVLGFLGYSSYALVEALERRMVPWHDR
jgi:NitT/TauT family transport system permease protein